MAFWKKLFGSSPSRPPAIASLLETIEAGTPVMFSCFAADHDLFMARLTTNAAYAATTDGAFTVVGVTTQNKADSMIVSAGSAAEHGKFSAACRRGGQVDQFERDLLTDRQRGSLRPVYAYSNFPQPGCEIESMDDFDDCASKLRSGNYVVVPVSPNRPDRSTTAGRPVELGSKVVRCCDKDWKVCDLQDKDIRGNIIQWRCPECDRNRMGSI